MGGTDYKNYRTFVNWVLEETEVDAGFCKNCRIWGSENPNDIREKLMHPQKCNVWYVLWTGGITGSYFSGRNW